MTELIVLQADHGEGFILHIEKEGRDFYMVVDGGPKVKGELRQKLKQLEEEGKKIDVVVITHHHDDHNKSVIKWLSSDGRDLSEMKLFVNLPDLIRVERENPEIAYIDSINFSKLIKRIESEKNIWIDCRNHVVAAKKPILDCEFLTMWALAPSEENIKEYLAFLDKDQKEKIGEDERHVLLTGEVEVDDEKGKECKLEELWRDDYVEKQEVNDSSIALLIKTCDDKWILLSGDASVETMTEGLKALQDEVPVPIKLDLFKLPHHGSKHNISNDFLQLIDCENFLITTNGKHGHPHRETIAKLIFNPSRNKDKEITLMFNYPLKEIGKRNKNLVFDKEGVYEEYKVKIEENKKLINF